MLLADSHCHLDLLNYKKLHSSMADVVAKANGRGVGHLLSISTTLEGFCNLRQQVGQLAGISLSCGVHPLNVATGIDSDQLYQLASDPRVVALGETGLDYYYEHDHQQTTVEQRRAFCQHIEVARRIKKPLIIHTRNAQDETLALLRSEQATLCGGVVHCFSGDRAMASALLELGFYLSISGIITFHNANSLREVVAFIPLDRLLIETDSPYLAPVPYRGKENQPAYVREVAEALARLKNITLERVAEITSENFCQLFRIPSITCPQATGG